MKSNNNYTIKELIHNQSFRSFVRGTASPEEINNWDGWIEDNDKNRQRAKEAASEIMGFEFTDPVRPDVKKEWAQLYSSTIGKQEGQQIGTAEKDRTLRWIYRVAAAILLISVVGYGIYLNDVNDGASTELEQITQQKTITTQSDEQKTLRFSDGSKVTLNQNSSLTYSIGLLHNETIQVILEGEAYFDAGSVLGTDQPAFAVTTPDGIIKDIGTKFLVTVRKDFSRVILQEGHVQVETMDDKNFKKGFEVRKGEMVEFSKSNILKREDINPTFYTSWATGFLQFDQTNIHEFTEYIEQRFNVDVQVTDADLSDMKIGGAVYFQSLEGLVRSVSEVTKIDVYQSKDRDIVYIGNPNDSNL